MRSFVYRIRLASLAAGSYALGAPSIDSQAQAKKLVLKKRLAKMKPQAPERKEAGYTAEMMRREGYGAHSESSRDPTARSAGLEKRGISTGPEAVVPGSLVDQGIIEKMKQPFDEDLNTDLKEEDVLKGLLPGAGGAKLYKGGEEDGATGVPAKTIKSRNDVGRRKAQEKRMEGPREVGEMTNRQMRENGNIEIESNAEEPEPARLEKIAAAAASVWGLVKRGFRAADPCFADCYKGMVHPRPDDGRPRHGSSSVDPWPFVGA